jgi:hypothetical protein
LGAKKCSMDSWTGCHAGMRAGLKRQVARRILQGSGTPDQYRHLQQDEPPWQVCNDPAVDTS